jgi:hypothetical protein
MGVKFGLSQREKHRLTVFENRVLNKTFGRKVYEVTAVCRRLHKQEHYDLLPSLNIIRRIKSRRTR